MEVLIYPIKSVLTNDELVNKTSVAFLQELMDADSTLKFKFIDDLNIQEKATVLILVQSGGSENYFKDYIFNKYNGPYYLLTYGASNSLAAALEILSFIKAQGKIGEVLHGDAKYIVSRIYELNKMINLPYTRLGIIGKPSDWLIASNVNYEESLKKFNIELVDILDQELVALYDGVKPTFSDLNYDEKELNKALKIKEAINILIDKYHLAGVTIRCFDIIPKLKTTSCLALAKLNDEGITAICEGDIPTMITAHLINQLLHVPFFQANPQYVSVNNGIVEFAHCTIPFKMCQSYKLTTHFESGIGVALKGELKMQKVTIVKIDASLKLFYLESGEIIENGSRSDRCRTQIKIKLDSDASYFLTTPLANHHLIIYGDYVKELRDYFRSLGLMWIR